VIISSGIQSDHRQWNPGQWFFAKKNNGFGWFFCNKAALQKNQKNQNAPF